MFSENVKIMAVPLFDNVCAFVIDDALVDPEALVKFAAKTKKRIQNLIGRRVSWRRVAHGRFVLGQVRGLFPQTSASAFRCAACRFDTHAFVTHDNTNKRLTTGTMVANARSAPRFARANHRCRESLFVRRHLLRWHRVLLAEEAASTNGATLPRQPRTLRVRFFEQVFDRIRLLLRQQRLLPVGASDSGQTQSLSGYDSALFTAPHITVPDKLTDDPRHGRLTVNALIACRRHSDGLADRWNR